MADIFQTENETYEIDVPRTHCLPKFPQVLLSSPEKTQQSMPAQLFLLMNMQLWTQLLRLTVNMTFDGNTGDALGIARKQTSASKIEGTVYVYKLVGDEWIYIDEVV